MSIPLKQSTDSQEIPLGYMLDSTDGDTEETALTIANTDIKLWKQGATTLADKNSGGATHISNGIYYCTLDATDTNTLGSLIVFVHVSGALAIRVECEVMTANRYDSLVAGTDVLHADLTQIGGVAQSATDLKDFSDAGYDPATHKVQGVVLADTTTTNTDMRGTDGANTTTPPTVTAIRTEMDTNSTKMAPSQTLDDYKATGFATLNPPSQVLADYKATGFSTHSAADVWTSGTRALTDKVGFSLLSTGADLILKDSLFALAIADAIWDEILTGATHNIATSAGKRVRQIGAYAIHDGTAQAGAINSITLATTANGGDGVYNRNLLIVTGGTGIGQTRTIVDYDDATKVCIVDRDWRVTPDATSEYQIVADDTPLVVDHGVAQGGTATTITLRDYASAVDNVYNNNIITIVAGAGVGETRLVKSYNGTTKVATMFGDDWVTTPDTSSVYVMMPYGCSCIGNIHSDALALINTECDTALIDYDPPTRAEATTDKNAIITEVNANETKIDAILLDTGTTLDAMIKRILGISQENFYIDNAVFSGSNMTSCRIRIYSVAGSVGTTSDVIATYNMTTTYAGDNLDSYKMVKS